MPEFSSEHLSGLGILAYGELQSPLTLVNDNSLPSTTEILDYNWCTMAVKSDLAWTHNAHKYDNWMQRCGEGRFCVSAEWNGG